jgi:hypothetical protein
MNRELRAFATKKRLVEERLLPNGEMARLSRNVPFSSTFACPAVVRYNPKDLQSTRGGKMAEPTYEELKARLADLEKKGAGRRTGELEFKVGEKGGVSVYGLGRFPVTLYYEQWIRLLDTSEKLREFLEENKGAGKLKLKQT